MAALSQEPALDQGLNVPTGTPAPDLPIAVKPKKDKKKKTGKSVETLFRTTLSSHIKLSDMADRKASLMISINAIIISITISAYAQRAEAPASLLLPSLLLLVVCLVTIIVSMIATHPTTSTPAKGTPDSERPVDLLFFGSFAHLSAEEYRLKVRKLILSDEELHISLIDNLYAQGQVLARKYRLLKFAYRFFMIGFSVVVVVSAVVLLVAAY